MSLLETTASKAPFIMWGSVVALLTVATPSIYEWIEEPEVGDKIAILSTDSSFDSKIISEYEAANQIKVKQVSVNFKTDLMNILNNDPYRFQLLDLDESEFLALRSANALKLLEPHRTNYLTKIDDAELRRSLTIDGEQNSKSRIYGIPYKKMSYAIVYDKEKLPSVTQWTDLLATENKIAVATKRDLVFTIAAEALEEDEAIEDQPQQEKYNQFIKNMTALSERAVFEPKLNDGLTDYKALLSQYDALVVPTYWAISRAPQFQNLAVAIPEHRVELRQYLAIPATAKNAAGAEKFINYMLQGKIAGEQMVADHSWTNVIEGRDYLRLTKSYVWGDQEKIYQNSLGKSVDPHNQMIYSDMTHLDNLWRKFLLNASKERDDTTNAVN